MTRYPLPPFRSHASSREVASFRVAAAVRGKRMVPCVLVIVPPVDGGEDGSAGSPALVTMHLYRAGECRVSDGLRKSEEVDLKQWLIGDGQHSNISAHPVCRALAVLYSTRSALPPRLSALC